MAEARLPLEGTAIHCQEAANDKCHAEDIHRQFVDKIVQTVVKVVRPIVSDSQQRGADGEHDETAEEQQVKQSTEGLLMDALLRQRIGAEPLYPHAPITLKSARLAFTPEPHVDYDLPHEHSDARRHHNEEH